MTRKIKELKIQARRLMFSVLALIVLLLLVLSYLASQARRDISEQFIDHAANRAVSEFRAIGEPMVATLKLVADWGANGLISLDDPEKTNRVLFPIFDRSSLLYGISIADIDSNSYYIRLEGDGLRTSYIENGRPERQANVHYWGPSGQLLKTETNRSDYDPRKRPWFTPALTNDDVHWTEPYQFKSSSLVGITASLSYQHKESQKPVVVAIDILLDELFARISELAPSDNSRVFIFRHDYQLYVPSGNEERPGFMAVASVDDPLIQKVFSGWAAGTPLGKDVLSVKHGGDTWWGDVRPLNSDLKSIWFGVMVPEKDIIGHAGKRQTLFWVAGLFSALVVVGGAIFAYRRSLRRLIAAREDRFDREDPVASVHRLIELGEGPTVEFKATMRMNLHTGKPGKEIELAWLKGVAAFLNTDGGTLLLGVTDDGEVTGLERDVYETEDKCRLHFKNLIAHHVGAELSSLVRFEIVPIGDKTVGVVSCERSVEPVFITVNKSEAFYIRNGPSSDELPVSKVLNYIKKRK